MQIWLSTILTTCRHSQCENNSIRTTCNKPSRDGCTAVQEVSLGTPMELAMGRRPRDLLDPASMNPEQLTSPLTKQDLLNEEIQKIGHENSP